MCIHFQQLETMRGRNQIWTERLSCVIAGVLVSKSHKNQASHFSIVPDVTRQSCSHQQTVSDLSCTISLSEYSNIGFILPATLPNPPVPHRHHHHHHHHHHHYHHHHSTCNSPEPSGTSLHSQNLLQLSSSFRIPGLLHWKALPSAGL